MKIKSKSQKRLIIYCVILFLFIFSFGSSAFMFIMERNLVTSTGSPLVRAIETEQVRLEASVNSEISLVLRMASSPLFKQYFTNPGDPELERMAFEEFEAYSRAFESGTVFWINDIDMIFYISNGEPYLVDPENPDNYWYYLTLYETEVYNFNINYNPDLDVTNLWINAPVFDDNNNPIGMMGTGINLSEFIDAIYDRYDGGAELYLFNTFGEITGARDVDSVANKVTVEEKLGSTGTQIINETANIEAGGAKYFELTDIRGVAVLGAIPALDWHITAIQPFKTGEALRNDMTVLFAVMMAVILIILVVFNIFAARLLRESELAKNRAEAAREAVISGIEYAGIIQKNMLPQDSEIAGAFSDYSVIWNPRDVVGGDIYWMKRFDKGTVICVCDCTGHGTPGALLTMLVVSALESAVTADNCHDTPHAVWRLEQRLSDVFNAREKEGDAIKDGCDPVVLFIANDGNVNISAGNMSVFICDGAYVQRIKGQKIFVGEGKINSKDDIKTICIPPNPGNKFYIASDGLFDQPSDKRDAPFGYKRFEQVILENHSEKQSVISGRIWEAFETYRGDEPRVDDFTLITFTPKND